MTRAAQVGIALYRGLLALAEAEVAFCRTDGWSLVLTTTHVFFNFNPESHPKLHLSSFAQDTHDLERSGKGTDQRWPELAISYF